MPTAKERNQKLAQREQELRLAYARQAGIHEQQFKALATRIYKGVEKYFKDITLNSTSLSRTQNLQLTLEAVQFHHNSESTSGFKRWYDVFIQRPSGPKDTFRATFRVHTKHEPHQSEICFISLEHTISAADMEENQGIQIDNPAYHASTPVRVVCILRKQFLSGMQPGAARQVQLTVERVLTMYDDDARTFSRGIIFDTEEG